MREDIVTCNACDYSWKARKVRTGSRRRCPKCSSYDVSLDNSKDVPTPENAKEGKARYSDGVELSGLPNIDNDPEILQLKKKLVKVRLEKEINQIQNQLQPTNLKNRISALEKMVVRFRSFSFGHGMHCLVCDESMKYVVWDEHGESDMGFECIKCGSRWNLKDFEPVNR